MRRIVNENNSQLQYLSIQTDPACLFGSHMLLQIILQTDRLYPRLLGLYPIYVLLRVFKNLFKDLSRHEISQTLTYGDSFLQTALDIHKKSERKKLTIFFSDIVDFTSISEQIEACLLYTSDAADE